MRADRTVLAAGLLAALAGCSAGTGGTAPSAGSSRPAYHGIDTSPAPHRPAFTLRDTTGASYDFGARTAGRPTLLYFGYTHCLDECPTAMADIATALRAVPPALRAATRVVFVTTDPPRDTPPVLRRWLDRFSPSFVGLLGTPQQLAVAQTAVGIPLASPEPGGAGGYSVTHSAVIFAYDAADRLPVLYPGGVTPSDIAADLPVLADRSRSSP